MTRRWIQETVGEPSFERLASELSGSELSSVLLEVMQRRAEARSLTDVLGQYQRDDLMHLIMVADGWQDPCEVGHFCLSRESWPAPRLGR